MTKTTIMTIKHPFSVIDGRKITLTEAFSWLLNYYDPNKKNTEMKTKILDSTCSVMLMWDSSDLLKFDVITNDINPVIKADYHYNCKELHTYITDKFDIIIYDPPYIDLKNRKDLKKYEDTFNYESTKTIEELGKLTVASSFCFNKLLKPNGIVIAKITNFHYKDKLRGKYDIIRWFTNNFYLFDEIVYRFYRPIENINWYSKKAIITHSYFLIFKKVKKDIKKAKIT